MNLCELLNSVLRKAGFMVVRSESLARLMDKVSSVDESARDRAGQDVAALTRLEDSLKERIHLLECGLSDMRRDVLRRQNSEKWEVFDLLSRLGREGGGNSCPLCGHEDAGEWVSFESHCIFGGGVLRRIQCPACDVVFGDKKILDMSPAELAQEYEYHYAVYSEGDSTEQEIRSFHLLNPSRDGVYLNYGAGGWSKSVEVLRQQGWNVFAYEPHDSASAGGGFLINSREELLKRQFDGVFSNNVLEHFRDPVDELRLMRSVLKQGGRMSHATPCYEYLYAYTRFHLFFYLGRSRLVLAEKSGLDVVDFVKDGEFMALVLKETGA